MRNNSTKPKVHPLFARDRFPAHIRYKEVFYDAAVLATRLMDSPQALQSDYCFYFGVNTPIDLPRSIRRRLKPAERPMEYACDKGIGELDDRDIQAVQAERLKLAPRVSFIVENTGGSNGWTDVQDKVDGISGCDSIITIDNALYQAARDKRRTSVDNAYNSLLLASIMIHEAAHAANFHLFGIRCEDSREVGLVAEAGYELESRIFGARAKDDFWESWQSRTTSAYMPSIKEPDARHPHLLKEFGSGFEMDGSFILKLFDDNFWSGEYVRRGAKALIPAEIAQSCRDQRDRYERKPGIHRAHTKIPISIRDLYRSGGPSYAQRLYSEFSNPDLILRSEQAGIEEDVVSSGDNSSKGSAGELYTSGEQQHTDDETSDDEDSDEDDDEDGDEDGEEDVEEDGMSVDEDESVVDEDGSDVEEEGSEVQEKVTMSTRTKRVSRKIQWMSTRMKLRLRQMARPVPSSLATSVLEMIATTRMRFQPQRRPKSQPKNEGVDRGLRRSHPPPHLVQTILHLKRCPSKRRCYYVN
jgi:hypothetical protein